MLTAAYHSEHVTRVLNASNAKPGITSTTIDGAHHFSFIAPFSPEIAKSLPIIAADLPSFDRESFSRSFVYEIASFFINLFI